VQESYTGFDYALSYNLDGKKKITVYLQAKNFQPNYAVDFEYKSVTY